MKKTILLFLFTLPVVIVVLVFAIAGFVGRQVMFVEITNVTMASAALDPNGSNYLQPDDTNNFQLRVNVGDVIDLQRYLIIEPARARFSHLNIDISNPGAVEIRGGRIHILQNMRSTDPGTGIEIAIRHDMDPFFRIFVIIATDYTRFDYFGFDYNLFFDLTRGADDAAIWRGFIWVFRDDGFIRIERNQALVNQGNRFDYRDFFQRGINIAPRELLFFDNPDKDAFLNSLNFASGDPTILYLGADGYAEVRGVGEVTVTVTTNFRDRNFSLEVNIEVV